MGGIMRRPESLVVVLAVCVACGSDTETAALPVAVSGGLEIYDAVAPASPAPDVASLYFTVVNTGQQPDTLTAVRTNVGMAMLHDMVTEGGLSMMRHVPTIAIGARDTLRLVPGSYHVMLSGLSQPVRVGDTISVTLEFERAGQLTFNAAVLTYTDVVRQLEPESHDR
jgi:copper(I)-binding protein